MSYQFNDRDVVRNPTEARLIKKRIKSNLWEEKDLLNFKRHLSAGPVIMKICPVLFDIRKISSVPIDLGAAIRFRGSSLPSMFREIFMTIRMLLTA